MGPFRCDFPVLLSGVPYLNPMVFKIGLKDCWKEGCYPEIIETMHFIFKEIQL